MTFIKRHKLKLNNLFIFFIVIYLLKNIDCFASNDDSPFNGGLTRDEALFQNFEAESSENVERFKSDIVRLLKRQNLYLNSIQSKIRSLNVQEEFKFLIRSPFENVSFVDQIRVSRPNPNIERYNRRNLSQIVVSISDDHSLNLWTITETQRIDFVDAFPLRIHPEDYSCIKVISFVQNNVPNGWINYKRADFRLVVVTLWRWNRKTIVNEESNALITDDMITVHVFNGYLHQNGLINVKPLKMSSSSIQAEQNIKVDMIADFDVIREVLSDSTQVWYLSVIQSNDESNAKFQLDLFKLKESKFDKMASLQTNEMRNAFRVKMATFNSQLYAIITYDRSYEDLKYYPIISVYKHVETFEDNFLRHESSLRNESQISRIESIHHLPGKDLIFMRQHESVIVYWFNGNTFVFFTEIRPNFAGSNHNSIVRHKSVTNFALSEMPNSKPFLITAYDNDLAIHYQIYDSFHSSFIHLRDLPDGFTIKHMKAFHWNNDYFLLLTFERMNGYFLNDFMRFSQIRRVVLRTPESNDDIRTYEFCEIDLKKRIENGIQHIQKLDRLSEKLLVINLSQPEINVDVIIEENLITEQILPEIQLSVRAQPHYIGSEVNSYARHVKDKLNSRENFIANNVAFNDKSQVYTSPIVFTKPISAQALNMLHLEGDFILNSVPFNIYLNNSLTIDGEQSLQYYSPILFQNGLKIDNFYAKKINNVPLKNLIDIRSRDSVRISNRHYFENLSIMNGTTATYLNDVTLSHVFQDHPGDYSRQYFYGTKHFNSLKTDTIQVDSNFNGSPLQAVFEDLIWLENKALNSQLINGSLLYFMNDILSNQTQVYGSVNGILHPDQIAKDALRTDVESEIFSSIFIENDASSRKNVLLRGLINGKIDLLRDVILLNKDQDFTHHTSSNIHFESMSTFHGGLNFSLMNHRIKSQDILTRNDVLSHQNMLQSNSMINPLLSNKRFARDLLVDSNVDIQPFITINGFDISEMFKQLDTVLSFNTPLFVNKLQIGRDLASKFYNQVLIDDLKNLLSTRLRKNTPQFVHGSFQFMNGEIIVKNLHFNYTKNGLKFPNDFVRKIDQNTVEENVHFLAPKYFDSTAEINNLNFDSNGLLNGIKISELFDSLISNSSLKTEVINGRKRFQNVIIEGDLLIDSSFVNDNSIDKVVLLNKDQNITKTLIFNDVNVLGEDVRFDNLKLYDFINNEMVQALFEDIVQYERGNTIHIANKHFSLLRLENLFVNKQFPVTGIDLENILKNAIRIDQESTISSRLAFTHAIFDQVQQFKTINGFPLEYFKSVILKSSKPIIIRGEKEFYRDLNMNTLFSKSSSINELNLTHLMDNSVLTAANQVFKMKPIFLNGLSFKNLTLNENLRIGEYSLKNYVKLDRDILNIFSPIVFGNLKMIDNNLFVSGLINNQNISKIAQKSIVMNPDGSFNLRIDHLRLLHVLGNLRLPPLLDNKPNLLKNIVRIDDDRALSNSIIFEDTIFIKNLHSSGLINRVNLTHLLQDAIYKHLPQTIVSSKQFHFPLKIFGDLRSVSKNSLYPNQVYIISGMINDINITRLFESTVTINDDLKIFGTKFLTGNVQFYRSIRSLQGLNNARIPEDFYLTFTNETIHGITNFHKLVHMNRDLEARLINRINLTEFRENSIFIKPDISIGKNQVHSKQQNSEDVLSVLRFQDSIHIKNLTIVNEINDIQVEELIPDNVKNVKIVGFKKFEEKVEPIHVHGQLNVVTINRENFDKDFKDDWIDTRVTGPIRIKGTLKLKQPTALKQLNIASKINNFNVDQFDGEFFNKLDQQIQRLNSSIENEINIFKRIGRNLHENVKTEFLFEIRFFVEIQNFKNSIVNFETNSYIFNNELSSDLILINGIFSKPNSTHDCFKYQSELYVPSASTKFISSEVSTFGGHGKPSFNMKAIFTSSINIPYENFIVQSTYSSQTVCYNSFDRSIIRVSHHLSYFEQRFSTEFLLNVGYFNETIYEVHKVQAFSTQPDEKIVVILFKDSHSLSTKLSIFKVYPKAELILAIQDYSNVNIIDFDISIFDGRFFMALVFDSVPKHATTLVQWNNKQFVPIHKKIDQFLYGSDYRYRKVSFLETPHGLFLAFSTIGSSSEITECSSFGLPEENFIDIWIWKYDQIEHYQRLSLGTGRSFGYGSELQFATFGKMVYLFACTGRDTIRIFRLQGSSRFVFWQTLNVPELSTLKVFWHKKSLYVAMGSRRTAQSRLLKAVISGASQSMQFFEQSMLDSYTLNSISSNNNAKLN